MIIPIILLTVGIVVGLLGFKLFRILLPIIGLVSGVTVGFIGFQGVFGKGTVSTTVAIFAAIAIGLVLALLSFVFLEIAILTYMAILGATIFSYLGVVLGLGDNGIVLFLLAVAGFIVGLSMAGKEGFSSRFIVTVTSFFGVSFILASVFLVAGDLCVEQLHETGVVKSVIDVVDKSFIWLLVWLGGSLIMTQLQYQTLKVEIIENRYEYKPKSRRS
jgi:hypothetical protein